MSRVFSCYQARGIAKRCNDEKGHNNPVNLTAIAKAFRSKDHWRSIILNLAASYHHVMLELSLYFPYLLN